MATDFKRLSILRHAKTEVGDGDDHARALTERGWRNAKRMGEHLTSQGWLPELVLCSTAIRARQTLQGLEVTLPTILSKKLYLASAGELIRFLHGMDDAVSHMLLIGHNPGLHQLAATLASRYTNEAHGDLVAQKYPTCTYTSQTFKLKHWASLAPQQGTLDRLAIGKKL